MCFKDLNKHLRYNLNLETKINHIIFSENLCPEDHEIEF